MAASPMHYDPLFTDEQPPWMPESNNQPGREIRLLQGVLRPHRYGSKLLRLRGGAALDKVKQTKTPLAALLVLLLVALPIARYLANPLYTDACNAPDRPRHHHHHKHDASVAKSSMHEHSHHKKHDGSDASSSGDKRSSAEVRSLRNGSQSHGHKGKAKEDEASSNKGKVKEAKASSNKSKANDGKSSSKNQLVGDMEPDDCALSPRSTVTLWCALALVLILKMCTVSNVGELIGSTDAAQREGCAGVFFRLVALWNFWGPACVLGATIVHFEARFSDSPIQAVRNVTSGDYYLLETPFNLSHVGFLDECATFNGYSDIRKLSRIALGAGAIMTFTIGSLFFGLGEIFKIDASKGYWLEEHVNFGFVSYFHSSWQRDDLLDGYDSLISSFHSWSEKHSKDLEMVGSTLQGLENGAMEAMAGPAKRFEQLGRQRLLGKCKYKLAPLFKDRLALGWDEALVVLENVSLTSLVELGPQEWFDKTMQDSLPLLKTVALKKLHNIAQVASWVADHFLLWDEVYPILDDVFDLDELNQAVSDPEAFLGKLMNIGPIALKAAIGQLKQIPTLTKQLLSMNIDMEDAVRTFSRFGLDELKSWAEKLAQMPEKADELLNFLNAAQGPILIAWTLAQLRPQITKALTQMSVSWDDAMFILGKVNSVDELKAAATDFKPLEKKFDKSWKIAQSRPKIEPELQKRGMVWSVIRETLETSADLKDVETASADPAKFLDNLDEWKKEKEELAKGRQIEDTHAAVNRFEQLKVIWPALCQCSATSLWLLTTYVETQPCVFYDQDLGSSFLFGLFHMTPGMYYIDVMMCFHVTMFCLVMGCLLFEYVAMKNHWKFAEKRGPIAIAGVLGIYVTTLTHLTIKVASAGSMAKTAGKTAVETLKSAPIGSVMSVGYACEAGARVTAAQISKPSEAEATTYTEHRNKLIEQKAQELAQVAPLELKAKAEKQKRRMEEARQEAERKKREAEAAEAEELRRRELEAKFLREQEEAKRAEEEAKRKAEEDARRLKEEEEAKKKQEEEERQRIEAEKLARMQAMEQAMARGQDISLDLPFVEKFSKIDEPEQWEQSLNDVAAALNAIQELGESAQSDAPPVILSISVTTIGKPDVAGMEGLLKRRADVVKRELTKRRIPNNWLRVGEPKYEDEKPRVIIRALKPGEEVVQQQQEAKEDTAAAAEKSKGKKGKDDKSKSRQRKET